MIDENTTFIGHSLSPAFIVDYIIKKYHETDNFIILESGRSKLFGFYKELDPEHMVRNLIKNHVA